MLFISLNLKFNFLNYLILSFKYKIIIIDYYFEFKLIFINCFK